MAIHATLCCIVNENKTLMLKKSAGLFGAGKWHSLGGKIDLGESPKQACIREVYGEFHFDVEGIKLLDHKIEVAKPITHDEPPLIVRD